MGTVELISGSWIGLSSIQSSFLGKETFLRLNNCNKEKWFYILSFPKHSTVIGFIWINKMIFIIQYIKHLHFIGLEKACILYLMTNYRRIFLRKSLLWTGEMVKCLKVQQLSQRTRVPVPRLNSKFPSLTTYNHLYLQFWGIWYLWFLWPTALSAHILPQTYTHNK